MTMDDAMYVTREMMVICGEIRKHYLLSTEVEEKDNFFNEQDRFHMRGSECVCFAGEAD